MTDAKIDPTPPSEYLLQPPGGAEHLLGQQCDLQPGDPVPFGMFARVALLLHTAVVWVHGADAFAKRTRRQAIAVTMFCVVNMSAIGGYFLHRVQAGAVAEERAVVLERSTREWRDAIERQMREWRADMLREIDGLRLDVREMRRELRRVSGLPPDSTINPAGPDKLTFSPRLPLSFLRFPALPIPEARCVTY